MRCPYCNNEPELVGGDVIYPHRPDLAFLKFFLCRPCDARVGCHRGTTRPLGRLANAELRQAKMAAHNAFDPLWKFNAFYGQQLKRTQAYEWLAGKLGIEVDRCHIGYMDIETCERVVAICEEVQDKAGSSQIHRQGGLL